MSDIGRDPREHLIELLKSHDWSYQYSDDRRWYYAGLESWRKIQRVAQGVPDADAIIAEYRQKG